MSLRMQCMGCADIIELAHVCRSVNEHCYLVFCPTCGKSFTKADNWMSAIEKLSSTTIPCMGCDIPVFLANVNTALKVPLVFCVHCKLKMLNERHWEECRRGGEDSYDEYAPRVIVPGRITGGH